MLSVKEAKEIVAGNTLKWELENSRVEDALNRILPQSPLAPFNHPLFNQTAVDGYAFRFEDWEKAKVNGQLLRVAGEISAGQSISEDAGIGTCFRIFTGAKVPDFLDTIVMQEHTIREGEYLKILNPDIKVGANLRKTGEQVKKGAPVLGDGIRLSPALIGHLLSLGVPQISVARNPRIKLIVTGSEFAKNAEEISDGKIFESNGAMLKAACSALGWSLKTTVCKDDEALLIEAVKNAGENCDLLLLTGGISVGDYDFSRAAVEKNGFKVLFHKIAMKPGKPLLFGRKENQAVFCLPGNPRSALMGFYLFVQPWLEANMGMKFPGLARIQLPLAETYVKKADRTEFLTASIREGKVKLSAKQDSHMLSSFGGSEGIAEFPAETGEYAAGTMVNFHLLR